MSRKLKLDFTGVESFLRASEGEHVCKIVSADEKTSQGGNDMIVVAYEVIQGEDKSARVFENYPLVSTALWKLKGLLQAIGVKADGKVQVDLDKLIGKICIVNVKHEEYNGSIRARVESILKYSVPTDEEDEVEDDEDDEVEKEQDEKPVKKSSKTQKSAEPEEEEDDDWEEEESPLPAPKKPAKEKPASKKSESKKSAKEESDDDDWDDDDWDE